MANNVKNVAVMVQARLGSKRLKNKMLQVLGGYTVLEWVLLRTLETRGVSDFVLATTEDRRDDELCAIAKELGFLVYRGQTDDVLNRFAGALNELNVDAVIRVCADNPFVDRVSLQRLIEAYHLRSSADLVFNHRPLLDCDYPDGFGAELIKCKTLIELLRLVNTNGHKEHLTSYIYENASAFEINGLRAPRDLLASNLKFDVDTPQDLELLNRFVDTAGISIASTAEYIVRAAKALGYPYIYGESS